MGLRITKLSGPAHKCLRSGTILLAILTWGCMPVLTLLHWAQPLWLETGSLQAPESGPRPWRPGPVPLPRTETCHSYSVSGGYHKGTWQLCHFNTRVAPTAKGVGAKLQTPGRRVPPQSTAAAPLPLSLGLQPPPASSALLLPSPVLHSQPGVPNSSGLFWAVVPKSRLCLL